MGEGTGAAVSGTTTDACTRRTLVAWRSLG